MQRVCTKCNTLVNGDGSFCPSCGEPLPAAVQLDKTPQTAPLGAMNDAAPASNSVPVYGQAYAQQNSYTAPQPTPINNYGSSNAQQFNNNVQPVNDTPMTLGQWVGTIILTTWFGLISLILCIVWGVSADTPINKKRYCQAMIIIQAIGLVVGIIFAIVFTVSMMSLGTSLVDALNSGYSSYYYY